MKFTEALAACCAIGMRLVSLHQDLKYKKIEAALKSILNKFLTKYNTKK
jgi:hypothetical protein